jgi:hypothetical protein
MWPYALSFHCAGVGQLKAKLVKLDFEFLASKSLAFSDFHRLVVSADFFFPFGLACKLRVSVLAVR